ncbi:YciI family protein [Microcella sp.]|uniref:YciI family protein n=1 Tax=Microcella sp. TaxID=1913979 RepID=UPI00299F808D|nr:YciI family protein [Microcella sp.]MDX2025435.1 YciI family protein [Microcella sp.]
MLIMRATDEGLAASLSGDFEAIINAMGAFNEAMIEAGVMVGGDGLSDPSEGFVVDFSTPDRAVTDGAYGPTEALFNGYWTIRVADRDEAIAWAQRCPMGPGQKLEVRRVTDESDFADFADNEYIQKEAGWREQLDNKPAE